MGLLTAKCAYSNDCINCKEYECIHDIHGAPVYTIKGFHITRYENAEKLAAQLKLFSISIMRAIVGSRKYKGVIVGRPEVSPLYCSYEYKECEIAVLKNKEKEKFAIYTNVGKRLSPFYNTPNIAQMVLDTYGDTNGLKISKIFGDNVITNDRW